MNLGIVLRKWRLMSELGMREAAKQIGISSPTLCRIEMGHSPDSKTLMAILNWLTASRRKE